MRVPLLDLQLQYKSLKPAIHAELEKLMDSQQFILGPKVEAFEAAICSYTGASHAIGASSGTDALLVVLMALEIGPGDAVITSPYTFFGTAGSISRVGAEPVFIDIDPATYNISVEKLREYLATQCKPAPGGGLLSHSGKKLRAIMPVHLFGLCCPMDEILGLASEYDLPLIEDAAQALGSHYLSSSGAVFGAGAMGEFGCFSFFPSKNLGAFGDAGMVVCRDEAMAVKIRSLRNHGMEERYFHSMIGGNFRLDALQAAILHAKLPFLDIWSAARRENAHFYRKEFARLGLDQILALPTEPYAAAGGNHHIYNQFIVRAPRRDELCAHLAKSEVGCAIYYPVPLHLQKCFAPLGYREGSFPESEKAALETVALPIFPELTQDQQRRVADVIAGFYTLSAPTE